MSIARRQDGGVHGGESPEVVMFAYDYYSGVRFTVIDELRQPATASLLTQGRADSQQQAAGGQQQRVEIFDDPYNWNGYIVQYACGNARMEMTVLFSEEIDFDAGDSATLGGNASFRSTDRNFVEVELAGGGETATGGGAIDTAGGGDGGATNTAGGGGRTAGTAGTDADVGGSSGGITSDDVTVRVGNETDRI